MKAPAWLRNFGLSDSPFSKDLPDDELWMPTTNKHLIGEMVDAVHAHQHILLVGEPGVG